jgi:hypothetical protein
MMLVFFIIASVVVTGCALAFVAFVANAMRLPLGPGPF